MKSLEMVVVEYCAKCDKLTIHYVWREKDTGKVTRRCAKCLPDLHN